MKIIGVTGGVGAGKSEVLSLLEREFHARILLTDELAHDLMRAGGLCFEAVRRLLGDSVVGEDGELDRVRIGERVFGDPDLLAGMNQIIHPAVRREVLAGIVRCRVEGVKLLVIESALLLEEDYDRLCDETWYIYAEERVRAERLSVSRGYSDRKIKEIMERQLSEEEFRRRCDVVIDNSGDFSGTAEAIRARVETFI